MMKLQIKSHKDYLKEARDYRLTHPDDLAKYLPQLEDAWSKFPYALVLAEELALYYQRLGQTEQLKAFLKDLTRPDRIVSQEIYARYGKVYKILALDQLALGNSLAPVSNLEKAEHYYRLANEKEPSHYPKINELTCRFLRAAILNAVATGMLAQESSVKQGTKLKEDSVLLLKSVELETKRLLQDSKMWIEKALDDNVWLHASRGESNVLIGDWNKAKEEYQLAMQLGTGKPFYFQAMRDQLVQQLIPAFKMLGQSFDPDLNDAEAFFKPL